MEDVYTIKVKTKPDTRNLYPSERRYSASTVSGLAWVHIALAATSFLLACLAFINPYDVENNTNSTGEYNETQSNAAAPGAWKHHYILVIAPSLVTASALAAGVASVLASVRWYHDRNIGWLFAASVLSALVSLAAFVLVAAWFVATSDTDITDFYKDKVPFEDFIVVKHSDVLARNETHVVVPAASAEPPRRFTKQVLSINILIAAFLELLWSMLSVKISYKGMRSDYRESGERRGNCVSVVTKIKGDTRNLPRNKLRPKRDLIEYPRGNIERLMLSNDDGFFKGQDGKLKNTETSSDIYKERMMSFLNKCTSLEALSNPERSPSEHSEPAPAAKAGPAPPAPAAPIWGDTPPHTVYNQNTLNFDNIFNFKKRLEFTTDKE